MKSTQGIPTVSMFQYITSARGILRNPLPFHHRMFTEKGDTFRLNLGFGRKIIFSRDSGFAEYVLQKNQKNYRKSDIQTKDMAKYLGQGLLTSEGEHWRKQRKLIQPAFHKKQLITLLEKLHRAILVELDKIEPEKPMDIFPIFNDLAFQTVGKSLFSGVVNQEEIDRLQYITEAAQRMLVRELRQPYLSWWFKLNRSVEKHLQLTGEARVILKRIIDERKNSGKKEGDLLDMLLEAKYDDGGGMTEEQLIDEILILFTAGHETTSNALTFTTQLLAAHPEEQEKIAREVAAAKEDSESLYDFLRKCPYTQQAIEEGMRLYPPAYFIDRVNNQDDEYEEKKFENGSSILFSIYEIHRHKDHWQNPDTFDPSRFAERRTNYYPFGAGPRKCIGNNFAMYEMVLTIAEIFSNYRVSNMKEKIEIQPLITLKPKNAILRFQKR